jgi:hypothetical protein
LAAGIWLIILGVTEVARGIRLRIHLRDLGTVP